MASSRRSVISAMAIASLGFMKSVAGEGGVPLVRQYFTYFEGEGDSS
jgi:hypothetical protein